MQDWKKFQYSEANQGRIPQQLLPRGQNHIQQFQAQQSNNNMGHEVPSGNQQFQIPQSQPIGHIINSSNNSHQYHQNNNENVQQTQQCMQINFGQQQQQQQQQQSSFNGNQNTNMDPRNPNNQTMPNQNIHINPNGIGGSGMNNSMTKNLTSNSHNLGVNANPLLINVDQKNSPTDSSKTDTQLKLADCVEARKIFDASSGNYNEECHSKLLESMVRDEFRICETKDEKAYKEEVLIKLNEIVKQWMLRVKRSHGYPEDMVENSTVKLLPYGSYKLGVSSPQGDIDVLILAPEYVDRKDDFFGILYPLLEELSLENKKIKELLKIDQEDTMMPIIKLNFYGIDMDLNFATMNNIDSFDEVIKSNLYNDEYFKAMDMQMLRSWNGYRNAEMIICSLQIKTDTLEENQKRLESFRTTLRCVKLWAKQNGLDSNKIGYLGGIAYCILVAKICQLYPYFTPAKQLERFFYIFGLEWQWSKWIVQIEPLNMDEAKLKPITFNVMTPAWPQSNTTYNTNQSTQEFIRSCMKNAHQVCKKILEEGDVRVLEKSEDYKEKWRHLFKEFNFFGTYNHFIEVNVVGSCDDKYLRWKSFIEANLRHLSKKLEDLYNMHKLKLHIWPYFYESPSNTNYPLSAAQYIGLKLMEKYDEKLDLIYPVYKFIKEVDAKWENTVNKSEKRVPEELNMVVWYKRRLQLPQNFVNYKEVSEIQKNEPSTQTSLNTKPIDTINNSSTPIVPHIPTGVAQNFDNLGCGVFEDFVTSTKASVTQEKDNQLGKRAEPSRKSNLDISGIDSVGNNKMFVDNKSNIMPNVPAREGFISNQNHLKSKLRNNSINSNESDLDDLLG